jgi:hypothetical protein
MDTASMDTPQVSPESSSEQVSSQPVSAVPASLQADQQSDRELLKKLLAEARNTKAVLEDFKAAISNATYQGHQMMSVAKGMAFLDAIMGQNRQHLDNLQERLKHE